jgi:hypothetical protein
MWKKRDIARGTLEEHYHRLRLNLTKEGIREPIDINTASLKDLVRLSNIGPITPVKIYRFRETHGPFSVLRASKRPRALGLPY